MLLVQLLEIAKCCIKKRFARQVHKLGILLIVSFFTMHEINCQTSASKQDLDIDKRILFESHG